MIKCRLKPLCIVCVAFVALLAQSRAADAPQMAHVKVAMRMIGDEVLRSAGDTVSRVLPIEKEGERYRISFEKEFEFVPDEMIETIKSKVEATEIAVSYLVEVEDCRSGMVVYSYEVLPPVQGDLIACRSRVQPKGCYSILFTVLDGQFGIEEKDAASLEADTRPMLNYVLVAVLAGLFLLAGLVLYRRKNGSNNETQVNPNIISMGAYQFDKLNMTLLFENETEELTSKEADLLYLLYTSANNTLERDEILKSVWGNQGDYIGRTLDVFISKLRKKLEGDTRLKIVNVRGVGYKMVVNK